MFEAVRVLRSPRIGLVFAAAASFFGILTPAVGCSSAPARRDRTGEPTADLTSGQSGDDRADGDEDGTSRIDQGPVSIRYDLAANLDRAEVWQGSAHLMDHGGQSAAKYTLGGWTTGTGAVATVDGREVMVLAAAQGKLIVFAERTDASVLVMRARAVGRNRAIREGTGPGDGNRNSVSMQLNGHALGDIAMPADALGTVRIEVPAGTLRLGDNTLTLRAGRPQEVPGVGPASLLVDWLALGSAADAGRLGTMDGLPLPSVQVEGEHPVLHLGGGSRVGYAMEVPAGARLRGVLRGAGELVVTAALDPASVGAEVTAAGNADRTSSNSQAAEADDDERSHAVGPAARGDARTPRRVEIGRVRTPARAGGARAFDFPLSAQEGEVARLDLEALGGDVDIVHPAVVTPRPASTGGAGSAPTPPKHVLLYLIDTLRADKLAVYNAESRVRTPGLDRFLERSVAFAGAHSQENWTKPSVATLLSSLMPWQHTAVLGESVVPRSVGLMPELMKERGFVTAAFIANGYVSTAFGFGRGWDTYRNYIREGLRTPAQYVAADVLEWLDRRDAEKPFFLYVHTIDPHVPYRPPESFIRMYDPEPYSGPVSFRRSATMLESIKMGQLQVNARDRAHLEAMYDGEITYHDIHFAAIMDGLARRGLLDETIVVVTADHGEEFWDHGSVGHGHNVYEELLHVPLVVRLPGQASELMRIDDAVGLVDVMPTILDALGQPIPEELEGHSVLPLMRGEPPDAPRYAVSGFMDNWRALTVGHLKLIQRGAETVMLHDLIADPGEVHDVATDRPIAVRYARGLLGLELSRTDPDGRHHAATRGSHHRAEQTTIDAETREQLRALGYVQ